MLVIRRWVSSQLRLTGIVGLAFVVLYVAGFFASGTTPEYDAPDQAWIDWFSDGGNQAQATIGILLFAGGALALIWFAALMGRELTLRDTRSDIRVSAPSLLVIGAGFAAAVTAVVGMVIALGLAPALAFNSDFEITDAEMLKSLEQIGIGIWLVGSGWAQGLMLAAMAYGARATGLLPRWLCVAGYVTALLMLLSVFFLPMVLFPLWILVVAIVLIRRAQQLAQSE